MTSPLVRAARGTLATNIFAGDTSLGPTGDGSFAGMRWFADQSPIRLGPDRSRTYSGLGSLGATAWGEFIPPLMLPVPVPAGMTPRRFALFGSGTPSVSDMVAKRDAMTARLSQLPGYRWLTREEAAASIASAQEFQARKSVSLTAFLAGSSSKDPVPEDVAYNLPQDEAQTLILAYLFYASAGSDIHTNGTAKQMVDSGEWTQSFVDGDLRNRVNILESLAKWDVDGVFERVFAPPGTYQGLGIAPWLIVGGVVVVACFLIAAGAYAFVSTTNFAKEADLRYKFVAQNCDTARANGDAEGIKACNELSKQPLNAGGADWNNLGTKAILVVAGAALAYALIVYGAPHLLEEHHKSERGWF